VLRQRNEQIQLGIRIFDLGLCVLSFLLAYHLREILAVGFASWKPEILAIQEFGWMLGASLVLHLVLYPYFGFYESIRLKTLPQIFSMVTRCAILEALILASLVFFFQAKDTSRSFFAVFIVLNFLLLLGSKIAIRVLLTVIRVRGYNYRQVLIVGTGPSAERVIQELRRLKHWGYVPFGLLSDSATETRENVASVPVLGTLEDLEKVARERTLDDVFFAPERIEAEQVSRCVLLCEELGVPVRFSLGFFGPVHSRPSLLDLNGVPVLSLQRTVRSPIELFVKRSIDVCGAIVGLGITGVLYPWIAYRIRRESPGAVIFKQMRVGENGRHFRCYKFRTMRMGAESELEQLRSQNQVSGPMFKLDTDPRVFPFGAFLRRTSLDELPQFFNVLRGDMSLVGTRPPTLDEVRVYRLADLRRLSIRPGITGLWQVSGRSAIRDFDAIVKLDTEYIDRWSLGLDLQILFRTLWVVLSRRGAV
jgi:exopolysaccharide biosynthesis polyprenyl glycosylphosphotransferase